MTGRAKGVAQLAALACVVGLLALLVWKLTHQRHAPPVGSAAPAFTLPLLGSRGNVSLTSLRGHPVVLNFWASWCGPCKAEAPVLERDFHRYAPRGILFFGVDFHDVASDARTFVRAHGLTFPILDDGPGGVTGSYGITQVPETYVLDSSGKIVAHLAGPIDSGDSAAQFQAALKAVA